MFWVSTNLPPLLMTILELLILTAGAALGLLLLRLLGNRLATALVQKADANAALCDSEVHYRTILDLTTDAIYSLQIGDDGQVQLE